MVLGLDGSSSQKKIKIKIKSQFFTDWNWNWNWNQKPAVLRTCPNWVPKLPNTCTNLDEFLKESTNWVPCSSTKLVNIPSKQGTKMKTTSSPVVSLSFSLSLSLTCLQTDLLARESVTIALSTFFNSNFVFE